MRRGFVRSAGSSRSNASGRSRRCHRWEPCVTGSVSALGVAYTTGFEQTSFSYKSAQTETA
jgi:hypothetical protein